MAMRRWVGVLGVAIALAACGGQARPPAEGAGEGRGNPPAGEDPGTDAPERSGEEVAVTPPPVPPDAGPQDPATTDFPPRTDGGVLVIPPDTGESTCVLTATVAEAIPEPQGGWDAVASLPPEYVAPPDDAPFGLQDPAACVDDGRPPLESWCERTLYDVRGIMVERTTRTSTGTHWTQTHGCDAAGNCVNLSDEKDYDAQGRPLDRDYWDWYRGSRIHELWQWGEDGHLEAFLEDSSHLGDSSLTLWRLRRTCDGRPAHYDVSHPGSRSGSTTRTEPFTYDASGRPTLEHTPSLRIARAWDAEGHLRAEERTNLYASGHNRTLRYYDAAGRELANRYVFSGGMGEAETWTWDERDAQGRVVVSRALHTYSGHRSYLTRNTYDAQGRKTLAWGTSQGAYDANRQAERWTYACSTQDPVRHEVDRGGDGSVDRVKTWTWNPEAQTVIESEGPNGYWTRYRYRCGP